MFNFMKKQYEQEKEAIKNKEKVNKEQVQARHSLTTEELQRLEEAKRCLNQKFPFDGDQSQTRRSDSCYKSTYSVTLSKPRTPPSILPKPAKKNILSKKGNYSSSEVTCDDADSVTKNGMPGGQNGARKNELIIKTSQIPSVKDAILAFEQPGGSVERSTSQTKSKRSVRIRSFQSSLCSTSLDSSRNSFTEESLAIAEKISELSSPAEKEKDYSSANLTLPSITPLSASPMPHQLVLQRRKSGDFGFTLRKGKIVNRLYENQAWKNVIFAEPYDMSVKCGLMPGDRLIEVNGVNVEDCTRDEVVELIKNAGDSLKLLLEPSIELTELKLRSDAQAAQSNGSSVDVCFTSSSVSSAYRMKQAIYDDQKAADTKWLAADRVWLVHKGGFALGQLLKPGVAGVDGGSMSEGKCSIRLEHGGEVLQVDEEDVEKANPPTFDHVEDLTLLRHLNESSMLHVLRQRFANNLIHTNAGQSTLLIMNPMHPLSTYTDKVIHMFKECKPQDMPPHIYAMARSVLWNLINTRRDQSIVLLGRSGSGKTMNAKHVLTYYAVAAGSGQGIVTVGKLNSCFTLLEAFGNSRTIMNTNTSNFTQITTANFDSGGQLTSISVQAVMLEKGRLVRRPEGEPTFHVFYQMLAGIDSNLRTELNLENLTEHCLFMTPLQRAEECQLAVKSWQSINNAMTTLAITEQEKKALFGILATIYHLGVAGTVKGLNGNLTFANAVHGQYAAKILGVSVDELQRVIFSNGQQQPQSLHLYRPMVGEDGLEKPSMADDLEGFVVDLYFEAFQALVALINRTMSSDVRPTASIQVFDFPGFRNPTSCNRTSGATLEDLLHNYLHERLQLLYHETVIISERDLYSREDVNCDCDSTAENESLYTVAHLIDGQTKPTNAKISGSVQAKGLLQLIEDAAESGLSDESFLQSVLENRLFRRGPALNSFIINHLRGTDPVQYDVQRWCHVFRDSLLSREPVSQLLRQSKKSDIRNLFGSSGVDGVGWKVDSSSLALGLKRTGSMRRAFAASFSGLRRKALSFQIKLQTDTIIDLLVKTCPHFVHCFLPQPDAGLSELRQSLSPSVPQRRLSSTVEDAVFSIPLVRSQLRGTEILPAVRLYRQGFPEHISFQEFLRRYETLIPNDERQSENPLALKQNVIHLMEMLDFDKASYRVGVTQIFLRGGGLTQLNERRDNRVIGWVIRLQSVCRSHLARQKGKKLKLQHLAASCIERNVRKLMAIREWPWWRLYTKVKPLLDVHRTETELRDSLMELEHVKAKLENLELERAEYKQSAEQLEAKLSEVLADLQEENSSSYQMAEMLKSERSEHVHLQKELRDAQGRFLALQQQQQRTEMELNDARMVLGSLGNDADDDDDAADDEYQAKLGRMRRDADLSKRKLEQQHAEELELLETAKRHLERRLTEAVAISDEQKQNLLSMKKKCERLNQEMADLRLQLEEQFSRNLELEKKQRKFDGELQKSNDVMQAEKLRHERLLQEKNEIAAQKYGLENEIKELKMDMELRIGKITLLEKEIEDLTATGKGDLEVVKLKQLKNKLENKVTELEEELDEQAGSIQQLEQAKLKLEMSQEKMRQQHLKELEEHDQDLENVKSLMQKKLKVVEVEMDEALQEKQKLIQEKRGLEQQVQVLSEQTGTGNTDVEHKLRRALKRTKILLRDSQMTLERQKDGGASRSAMKLLRNQLDDAELSASVAAKAKKMAEMEIQDLKQQLDDALRAKQEVDRRCHNLLHENSKLQTQFEENEEEMAELMKKYKASIQQNVVERVTFQDQSAQLQSLMLENERTKQELSTLQSQLDHLQSSCVDREVVLRLESKISDLGTRLDLEQTVKQRAEAQVSRLKEQLEKDMEEKQNWTLSRSKSEDASRRSERKVRELEQELNDALRREADANQRRTDMEKKMESVEAEFERSQADLQLALRRIDDFHAVMDEGMEYSDGDSDIDSFDGDGIELDSDD